MATKHAVTIMTTTALVIATIAGAMSAESAHATVQSTFYASPTGSGTACSQAAPCALQQAQLDVRAANDNMTGDIEVVLADGIYQLPSTFELVGSSGADSDSATNGHQIVYRAATNANPVLSGGVDVSEGEVVGGQTVDWALHDGPKNIYRAYVGTDNPVLQMYVNDVPATIARGEANPAGFNMSRRPMTIDAFRVLDGGTWTVTNDDHADVEYGMDFAGFPANWQRTYPNKWIDSNNRTTTPANTNNDIHYTPERGDDVEFEFSGTGIEVLAEVDPWHSDRVDVYLDGVFVESVSQVNATKRGAHSIFARTNLTAGTHTIRLVNERLADLTIASNPAYGGMSGWRNPGEIIVHYAKSGRHWQIAQCPVDTITGGNIRVEQPCGAQAFRVGAETVSGVKFIENAYELLSTPGHFYYDISDKYLYYIPRAFENLQTADVQISRLETIVRGDGGAGTPLTGVTFSGVAFKYGTWLQPLSKYGFGGVQGNYGWYPYDDEDRDQIKSIGGNVVLSNAHGVTFEDCTFVNLGGTALVIDDGSKDNVVRGNAFANISGGAIQVGEATDAHVTDPARQTSGNIISNNYVATFGLQYPQAVGIFGGYNRGLELRHNEIENAPYSGISVGWGWGASIFGTSYSEDVVIDGNLVAHVMQSMQDGGAMYTLGLQPNSTMTNNYVIGDYNTFGAIYLDNGVQDYDVTSNVVREAYTSWLYVQNQGIPARNNTISGNYADQSGVGGGPNANGNTLGATTSVTDGNWPAGAVAVMRNAGLESAYEGVKSKVGALVDDTDIGITYTGQWTSSGSNRRSADFQQSAHYTSRNGDELEYSFTGTGLDVIAETGPDRTTSARVYIDDVEQAQMRQQSPFVQQQQVVFSASGLTAGQHTIRIVNNATGTLLVDALRVKDTPVTGMSTAGERVSVSVGLATTLNPLLEFTPAGATDRRLLWTSSNPAVATVSEGVVTGVAPGQAIITATSLAGNPSVQFTVDVGVNLAYNRPATQSSTYATAPISSAAGKAVDGNTEGDYNRGSVTHTNSETQAWWMVDLGSTYSLDEIWVYGRTDCCADRLSNYHVRVLDANQSEVWSSQQTTHPNPLTKVDATGVSGRYVKIQLSGTNALSLAEVKVFGANLAQGKTATQSSTYTPTAAASKAVDGVTNGNYAAGSVTHTNSQAGAWWMVDLGGIYNIGDIAVFNRTDCCGERLGDYEISVLDQDQAEVWSDHQTVQPQPQTIVNAGGAAGRYVKVRLTGTNVLSLAEVMVFSQPSWAWSGTKVNDASGSITKSGTVYSANRGNGDYLDDLHNTSSAGGYYEFTFTGTKIRYIAERNASSGIADVTIDGTPAGQIGGYSSVGLVQQTLFEATGLSSGSHTIRITRVSGNTTLDAFEYE